MNKQCPIRIQETDICHVLAVAGIRHQAKKAPDESELWAALGHVSGGRGARVSSQ